jgi:hypothetical protein
VDCLFSIPNWPTVQDLASTRILRLFYNHRKRLARFFADFGLTQCEKCRFQPVNIPLMYFRDDGSAKCVVAV